jgi:hypothetical protein
LVPFTNISGGPITVTMEWDKPKEKPKHINLDQQECMIERFFKNERMKPIGQRSNACMISCPCPKCRVHC